MSVADVPQALRQPVMVDGRVVAKTLLDLTVYLSGPTEAELADLIDLYRGVCPPDRWVRYNLAEFGFWPMLAKPPLTASGRAAAQAGVKNAFLEPVRQRIRDGRAFELQFWDGVGIADPGGSWSFNCQRIHKKKSGLHAFVRILMPLDTDLNVLRDLACAMADRVSFSSGHGGLAFVYDPWYLASAFDAIYALARRYWGVDIEHLNSTLPRLRGPIKGVNWLTMLDHDRAANAALLPELAQLAANPMIRTAAYRFGHVWMAGPQPVAGDQHRDADALLPYEAVARALAPLLLTEHPDFPGERFSNAGNTLGWMRRLVEPDGWR